MGCSGLDLSVSECMSVICCCERKYRTVESHKR